MNQDTPIIGIIGGKGRMGAYFAEIFKKAGHKVLISDQKTKLTNAELAQTADVVIVSVPIHHTEKVINQIADKVRKDAVLIDLTSLKEFPVKAMLKAKSEVIGLHPMFGNTNPISGQTVIICPVRSKKWHKWIKEFLEDRGAKVSQLSPKEHDQIMAIVQALVHFADIAFGHALKDLKIPVKKILKYASPASELKIAFVGRLLAQNPDLYADIQIHNKQALKVLKQYSKSIQELIRINEKEDHESFKKYFKSSGDNLKEYRQKAFADTNYLIHAILERRKRIEKIRQKPEKNTATADIAVLGPENTNSDLAAQIYIEKQNKDLKINYVSSIHDIFEMVENKQVKIGIVPIENLLNGTVRETFDELFNRNAKIIDKFNFQLNHCLVAMPGVKKKDIDTIASHKQSLGQCKNYLNKNFPNVQILGASSTTAAYEKMRGENDKHTAVIIAQKAAKKLDCNIIGENIDDAPENRTTFVVIKQGRVTASKKTTKKSSGKTLNQKSETSIAFSFSADKPGSLLKVFQDFAGEKINMTRIESRPSRKELGNYIFFLAFEESLNTPRAQKALKKVKKRVTKLKMLGTYPV